MGGRVQAWVPLGGRGWLVGRWLVTGEQGILLGLGIVARRCCRSCCQFVWVNELSGGGGQGWGQV